MLDACSRFDQVSPDEIRTLGSCAAVTAKINQSLAQAKVADPLPLHAIAHTTIQNRLKQIPNSLALDFDRAPFNLGLSTPVWRNVVMQTARNQSRHARHRLSDGDLVIIDRDDLFRTALFTYFSVRGRTDVNALLAQAFVLMHAAILPKAPLPFQNLLSFELVQGRLATPDFLECLNTSLDFIALHELGHVYIETPNSSRDFFHTRLEPPSPADNLAANQRQEMVICDDPWRDTVIRVGGSASSAQLTELFCDAFALTGRTIMDMAGRFSPEVLEALTARLVILSRAFFLDDMIAMHGQGPSGIVNIGRLSMANRHVPQGQPMEVSPSPFQSHPASLQRFTSLWLHSGWICRNAGVAMDPLRPNGDDAIYGMLRDEWSPGVRMAQDIMIDAFRGMQLPEMKTVIRLFDSLQNSLGFEPSNTPPALKAFALVALAPLLQSFAEQCQEVNPNDRRQLQELAEQDLLTRIPPNSRLGGLAGKLCASLLKPRSILTPQTAQN